MEGEVFASREFKKWAEENVVLLMLDYPRMKTLDEKLTAQNAKLMDKYRKDVEYFPTILVFNPKEKIIGKLGPAPNATSFIKNVETVIK